MSEASLSSLLPWAAGGLALAGLENKVIGDNLPPELKKVNLGVGASTGLMMAMGPQARIAALGSIPIKQSLLFGIGSMDRLRKQQQALTDTNLETAKLHKETAGIDRSNARGARLAALAFLLPAAAGAGALGYYAYNQRKKPSSGANKFQVVGEAGKPVRRQKIKMEIPSSAFSPDFFDSLREAEGNDAVHTTVLEKKSSEQPVKQAMTAPEGLTDYISNSWMGNAGRAGESGGQSLWNSKPVKLLRAGGHFLGEMTGIPSAARGMNDFASAAGHLIEGDNDVASRYALGGLGNMAVAIPSVRQGLVPMLGKTVGRERLLRNGFTGAMNNLAGKRKLTKLELDALNNPATRGKMFKILHNSSRLTDLPVDPALGIAPGTKGLSGNLDLMDHMRDLKYKFNPKSFVPPATPPTTLAGEAYQGGRLLKHHASENLRRLGLLLRRNPNATMIGAGTPLSFMGGARDAAVETENRDKFGPSGGVDSFGEGGLPISSNLQQMLYGMTTGQKAQVAGQMTGLGHQLPGV